LLRLSLAGSAMPEECNASGQIGLGGLSFSGPMDHPECGKLDLQVDGKGGLTGTLTDFPTGGSLSQLQVQQVIMKGLIPKGGPANVAARAIWSQDGSTGESLNQINVGEEATETFTAVSAGDYLSALLTSKGRVFNAVLLYSHSGITPVVKEVPGVSNAMAVSCGTECFAVDGLGTVYTWTWTLGHDEFTPAAAQVYTGVSGVKAIAAGKSGFVLAIKNDGTVWTWGANGQNQLGDGTTEDRPNPAQLLSLGADNAAVAAGDYQGVVLKNDGGVYFWGRISNALEPFPAPTLLEGVAPATRISAGGSYNLAQLNDGSVYAWGHLQAGLVPGISNPLGITAGAELYFSPLFLKSDGTVWRVGFSMIDGSMQTPEQVNGLSDIQLLDAYSNAFYIRGDGAVVMQASTDTEPYVVTGIL